MDNRCQGQVLFMASLSFSFFKVFVCFLEDNEISLRERESVRTRVGNRLEDSCDRKSDATKVIAEHVLALETVLLFLFYLFDSVTQ